MAQAPSEAGPPASVQSELRREQHHLDRVLERVDQLRSEAARSERASLRSPLGGTPQAVYERDVTVMTAAARRADLDMAGDGLLFGRLDRDDGAVLHVGRLGVRTAEQEPLVVDWRAPAAAAYYQATAAEPLGVIRRRTITTSGDAVRALEDELLEPGAVDRLEGTVVVGDGAFMAAVSRERGTHMRDIVATIQAEQDRAVRAPDSGALVVTGGPGTGKTAVALHRVAYLLYARRDYYARRDVLVVGPSAVFVDYISQVLPALGETSVRLASVGGLPALPPGLRATGYDPPAVAAVKGSARMATLVRRVVQQAARPVGGSAELRVVRYGTELRVRPNELLGRRDRVARSARTHNSGRTALVDGVVDVAWRAWTRRPGATRIEADDRKDFTEWLHEEPAFLRVVDALWPVLEAGDVFLRMRAGSLPWQDLGRGTLREPELTLLADAWRRDSRSSAVTAADAAILDELRSLLGPPPTPPREEDEDDHLEELARAKSVTTYLDRERSDPRQPEDDDVTYAHVVVDEAQDVTPMQWRMLGRRAGGATWTIVGDWAQSAWPSVAEVRDAMGACLGRTRVTEVALSTNYRTSTEIAALAAGVLGEIDPGAVPPAAVRATGTQPVLVAHAGDALPQVLRGAVADVLRAVSGTVAVICPHAALDATRTALADALEAQPRLTVLDTWAVKGLEFDGCVVVAPEDVVAEGITATAGLRSLYVAITRATQRLTVVSAGPLPPALAFAPAPPRL